MSSQTTHATRARTEHDNLHRARAALVSGALPYEQALRVVRSEFAHARASAVNNQEQLHWCEAERIFESTLRAAPPLPIYVERRADEIGRIEAQLDVLSNLYSVVLRLLERQSGTLALVERNVDSIQLRVDAAAAQLEDAAPRTYRVRPWYWWFMPRSLGAWLRCAVFAMLAGNLLLIWWVV